MSILLKMYKTRSSLKKFSVGFKDCCRLHKRYCRLGAAQAFMKRSFLNNVLCDDSWLTTDEGTTESLWNNSCLAIG